ncbi:glycoside hydrolase family 2 protein [Mucilaginibacter sp.]
MLFKKYITCTLLSSALILMLQSKAPAQEQYELNSGWKCQKASAVTISGSQLSKKDFTLSGWENATVPGTVLTTQLNNKQVPDPFIGMNNEQIPDIYRIGRDYYTYWFVKDFKELSPQGNNQVYLNLRGVNYSYNVYLNGHQLNSTLHSGMFLRATYNIGKWLAKDGNNRLAVIVYPPDVVGNPNGGQGGDGTIARGVGIQYTAGWDWIQPIKDRNTGIWDKVTITKTGAVRITDPHVITLVPGVRQSDGPQQPAIIQVSAQLENPTALPVNGKLQYIIDGQTVTKQVTLKPNSVQQVQLSDFSLKNPKLWWPNGYGPQNLYDLKLEFIAANKVSDKHDIEIGVRQITSERNEKTESRQINVNGQKIFIKGGDWIVSDEMLRFSDKRYDAEVRLHHDMNLNLIRVWGGALVERPEFYAACDKYGMLVFQDMWGSGDCNGRWQDPMKKDDQWTRRQYPDDHQLYVKSIVDQIKMIRNYPSLAIWCGGNEITPPEDILLALRDTIMPKLDNTRWFVDYSNSEDMSRNVLGDNGDGPYGIQPLSVFWDHRTFPFNSEVGSVGINDIESFKRFMPATNMKAPEYDEATGKTKTDSVWEYHKYIGYDAPITKYGKAKNLEDFAEKAQLVNYDQYRALMEGFSSHMWDWYTGVIIWKTQNPWTALRGQMYDYYLDPNACLYGLHHGSEPLHVMCNPTDGMVMIANNTFKAQTNMMLVVKSYTISGKEELISQVFSDVNPATTRRFFSIKENMDALAKNGGGFIDLELLDKDKKTISQNIYWLADDKGEYSGIQKLPASQVQTSAKQISAGRIAITLTNPANAAVAFFNRLSLVDAQSNKRLLPVFYSDNYVSVLPGTEKTVVIDYDNAQYPNMPLVSISGWNLSPQTVAIQ